MRIPLTIAAAVVLLAACDAGAASSPPPSTSPSAIVSPASPSPSVSPAPSPTPADVLLQGAGTYSRTAAGGTAVAGRGGNLRRYCVQVEDGIETFTPDQFAAVVDMVLADPRGWIATNRWMFQRVPDCGAAHFRVRLTTPANVDRFCAPLDIGGQWSCRQGGDLFINLRRWTFGVPHYDGDLHNYRIMLINHETGHFLGRGHVSCARSGDLAPVMQQQSISLGGCRANPFPYPDGVNYVG